jgi:hypothetical protein
MVNELQPDPKRRSALVGAAAAAAAAAATVALPTAAGLIVTMKASAAPVITITNLGVANGGGAIGAQSGWHAFRITATADSGDVVAGCDFATITGYGLFGNVLQRWVYTTSTFAPTPTGKQSGNTVDASSLDTHLVTLASQSTGGISGTEDSDQVNPGLTVSNTTSVHYGTGTAVHGALLYGSGFLQTQPLAYVVLKDGTAGTASFGLSEVENSFPQGPPTAFSFSLTFSAAPTNKIVSLSALSAGAPTTYGNKLTQGTSGVDKAGFDNGGASDSTIHVLGSAALGYQPGHATSINSGAGEQKFYVEATGWSPAGDEEIFALNVKVNGADPTAAQDSAIINDINASNTGVVASTVSGQFSGGFPGYDILLAAGPSANNSPSYLAIDFSADTITSGVTVTDVAAVPEPVAAGTGLTMIGAAAISLGRRRRSLHYS